MNFTLNIIELLMLEEGGCQPRWTDVLGEEEATAHRQRNGAAVPDTTSG